MKKVSKTQTQENPAPLATELIELAEDGREDELETRIDGLSMNDFIRVMRAVQTLDNALCEYGEKWKNSEYWGRGVEFPA